MVRSFLAINLSLDTKRFIQENIHQWRYLGRSVRWVKPDNIHLTLKFLGDITQEQVSEVSAVLQTITSCFSPFRLELATPGLFPNLKRPRILWVGLKGDIPELLKLQSELDKKLASKGFQPDDRPFIPHITVGRIKGRPPSTDKLSHFLQTNMDSTGDRIDKLCLYQSILTPSGAVYKPLGTYLLDKASPL